MKKNRRYRLLFMGTPEFAVLAFLKIIKSENFEIVGIVTQIDKKSGRGYREMYSPIKKIALKNKIKVYQPVTLRDNKFIDAIKKNNLDIILVVAYGKIIPPSILDLPKYGCINIHPSLLPKYRGPAPMQWALLNGEKITGITIMLMNDKMDEGDILFQQKVEIKQNYNIADLHDLMAIISADKIEQVLLDWINKKIKPRKQNPKVATYSKIIKKRDGLINWNDYSSDIINKYRAYHPWPGVYTYLGQNNKKIIFKLIEIEAGKSVQGYKKGEIYAADGKLLVATNDKNSIILKRVQLEGKKPIFGKEFISGYNKFLGKRLK